MSSQACEPERGRRQPLLRRADQAGVALVLTVALVLIAVNLLLRHQRHGGLIEIDRSPPQPLTFEVDINRADWPELTLLPGIGEKLAQRIVASRKLEGPFQQLEDLDRVQGIGPKTIERLQPYIVVRLDEQPLPPEQSVGQR